jgi:uncharacterized protein (TIGR03435 family)
MKMMKIRSAIVAVFALAVSMGLSHASGQDGKKIKFDVVSIRPSPPDADPYKGGGVGVTPQGFHSRTMALRYTFALAYFKPFDRTPEPFKNAPSWLKENYDIEAKVAPEDAAEWQRQTRQGFSRTSTVLQDALQAMLEERLKLKVHRVPIEVDGYALVVGKHGSKLKEISPDEPTSDRVRKLLDDGKAVYTSTDPKVPEWTLYDTSMEALVSFMQGNILLPIVNQTALQGRYHFVLKGHQYSDPEEEKADTDGASRWELEQLGLELKRVKVPSEVVVIDHIERPSEN